MTDPRDRELGMNRRITRRDFLNGMTVGVGGAVAGSWLGGVGVGQAGASAFAQERAGSYPPGLTGLRGSHPGAFEIAHEVRDGTFAAHMGAPTDTREVYDLIVVGAGISGLSAAHFFRKKTGQNARILILDNHDDFGGHAKRNEFRVGGRLLLSYGGVQTMERLAGYSPAARTVLKDLSVDLEKFYKYYDQQLYASMKLGTGTFFDRETFGEDRLVAGMGTIPWAEFVAKAPLSDVARRDIVRVYTEKVDYLPGLTRDEKRATLREMSYADFLTTVVKLSPEVLPFFQSRSNDLYCVGIDAASALSCLNADTYGGLECPGFDGMGLTDAAGGAEEPYIFHFPDGGASIARLLVRALIPDAMPGRTMEDVVLAKADYGRLDRKDAPVRIRLSSPVVQVRHLGDAGTAREVEVTYVRNGQAFTSRARGCVMACYNSMIPHLCPDLPAEQKVALAYGVKSAMVYTQVAIRNWTSFRNLGVRHMAAPGSYHTYVALDFPVSIGDYKFPSRPEEPMVVYMLRTPCQPGLSRADQYRAGRYELLSTDFETFERRIRDQLARTLAPGGFDPARDIAGITVNRWAHGYAWEGGVPGVPRNQWPNVLGREPFGRIAIANSDAGYSAYVNSAIDQANRAVEDLTRGQG